MHGAGLGMGGFWIVVVFLVVVVAGVVAVVTMRGGRRASSDKSAYKAPTALPGSARDVIEMRFARGEITAAEMRTMLDDLDSRR